jgi:integrase
VLVLGDAGLRCEELAQLERRDFLPARKGAQLRALDVGTARAIASAASSSVPTPRARSYVGTASAPALSARPPMTRPLLITLGRRRRDGTYTRVGGRCGQAVLADVLKRLGAAAELPEELRHPHALRHTCATELLRADDVTVADVRVFLGHASSRPPRSTSPPASSAKRRSSNVANEAARRSTRTARPHEIPCVKGCSGCRLAVKRCALCPAGSLR